jgi:hypothetical protein
MPRYLNPIDLTQQELKNARVQNLASAPSTPVTGQIYFDTGLSRFRYWNGSAWVDLTAVTVSGIVGTPPINANTVSGTTTISISAASGSSAGSLSSTDYSLIHTATSTNTNSSLVQRDGSGNFSATAVTGLSTPVNPSDAANKSYVDAAAQGLDVKNSVRIATTTTLPAYTFSSNVLTATTNGAFPVIDGITLNVNDRILVKNETAGNAPYNGIYTLTNAGGVSTAWTLTRSTDTNTSSEVTSGLFTFVSEGTTQGGTSWILTTIDPITLNTTSLTFSQFSGGGTYLAGSGLTLVGNTFSVVGTTNRISIGTGVDISSAYVGQSSITTLGTITTGVWHGTAVTVPFGGTGVATFTTNGVLLGNSTNSLNVTVAGTANQVFIVPSGGGAPVFGQVNLASSSAVIGTLGIGNGGTGSTSFTTNGVVLGGTTLGVTAAGTANQVLIIPGAGGAPIFGQINLASSSAVTGTLAVGNGGTGQTTTAGIRTAISATTKFSANVGNGAATSIVVNHALGTQDVSVTVYTNASPFDIVYPDIQLTDTNNITLIFGTAPTTNAYRVIIIG